MKLKTLLYEASAEERQKVKSYQKKYIRREVS